MRRIQGVVSFILVLFVRCNHLGAFQEARKSIADLDLNKRKVARKYSCSGFCNVNSWAMVSSQRLLFVMFALCLSPLVAGQNITAGKEIDKEQLKKLQQKSLAMPLPNRLTVSTRPGFDEAAASMTFIWDKENPVLSLEQILGIRRGQNEMPLPGAIGTLPSALGYEEWKKCSSIGREILEFECDPNEASNCAEPKLKCDLYDPSKCVDLKLKFRDSCFTKTNDFPGANRLGTSVNNFPGVNGMETSVDARTGIDVSKAKTLAGVLRIGEKITCSGTFLEKNYFLTAGHCNREIRSCRPPDCLVQIESNNPLNAIRNPKRLVSSEYDKEDWTTDFSIWELDELRQNAVWVDSMIKVADSRTGRTAASRFRKNSLIIGAASFPCPSDSPNCNSEPVFLQPSQFTNCAVTCSNGSGLLFHDCQSFPGMSGAPVFTGKTEGGRILLAGIHNGFIATSVPPICNAETQTMVSMTHICKWINTNSNIPELKEICDGSN